MKKFCRPRVFGDHLAKDRDHIMATQVVPEVDFSSREYDGYWAAVIVNGDPVSLQKVDDQTNTLIIGGTGVAGAFHVGMHPQFSSGWIKSAQRGALLDRCQVRCLSLRLGSQA